MKITNDVGKMKEVNLSKVSSSETKEEIKDVTLAQPSLSLPPPQPQHNPALQSTIQYNKQYNTQLNTQYKRETAQHNTMQSTIQYNTQYNTQHNTQYRRETTPENDITSDVIEKKGNSASKGKKGGG